MSSLNIQIPLQLSGKLSKNKFYHHQITYKLENILKTVLEIISVYLVC